MKPAPDLFNLVKALTKYEKRYVTLFLTSGLYKNNKNGLSLFKAISRQKQFNDDALKKQLGKSFSKRLSAEKNNLFELILESLMFLYRDSLPEKKVVRNRMRSWFLFQKGLRPSGWKYLHKAQSMAEEYEFFPQLALQAYNENHETRLASAEEVDFSEEKYYGRDAAIISSLSEHLTLHTLFTEMIVLQKRYGNNMKAAEIHLERIIQHPLMDPGYELTDFSTRMSRLENMALYYSMKNNHREAYNCYVELVGSIEKSKVYLEHSYPRYLNALSNQLMHAAISREYDQLPFLIQKRKKALEGLNYFSFDKVLNEFVAIRFYELIAFKNRADTVKGPALLSQLEKKFIHYRGLLRDTVIIGTLFVFGCYHFYLGNLKKALHHFNDLIDSTDPKVAQNFQGMSRLIKLLLHHDLGHYDLLPSLSQSTQRMLNNMEQLGTVEKELISYCRKSSENENKSALEKLLPIIQKHAPGYYSYGAWCDFEFEAWAESRLKNKPFAQVISEKQLKAAKENLKTGKAG